MGIGKEIVTRLQQVFADGGGQDEPSAEGGMALTVEVLDWQARIACFDVDRYSAALRSIEVGISAPMVGDMREYLCAHAAEIARTLSYLEEPVAVWELDVQEQMVQLRSSPPCIEGEVRLYWEVSLLGGKQPCARIVRYRWAPGMAEREVVAYPATFALIGRVAESLIDALRDVER